MENESNKPRKRIKLYILIIVLFLLLVIKIEYIVNGALEFSRGIFINNNKTVINLSNDGDAIYEEEYDLRLNNPNRLKELIESDNVINLNIIDKKTGKTILHYEDIEGEEYTKIIDSINKEELSSRIILKAIYTKNDRYYTGNGFIYFFIPFQNNLYMLSQTIDINFNYTIPMDNDQCYCYFGGERLFILNDSIHMRRKSNFFEKKSDNTVDEEYNKYGGIQVFIRNMKIKDYGIEKEYTNVEGKTIRKVLPAKHAYHDMFDLITGKETMEFLLMDLFFPFFFMIISFFVVGIIIHIFITHLRK